MNDASQQSASIRNVERLEDILSQPSEALVKTLERIEGDILVLGVGGKMGPSLARMAKRASQAAGSSRRVIGVARLSASVGLTVANSSTSMLPSVVVNRAIGSVPAAVVCVIAK